MVVTNLLSIQPNKKRHTYLSLAHVNAWSIRSKIGPFQHYLQDEKIDLCTVTETWLKPDNIIHSKEITPPGYEILAQPRTDGRQGGGVAHVYNSSIKVYNITQADQPRGLEYMNVHVKFRNKILNLYIIYRHPNSSALQFIESLANLLEENILSDNGELVLTGDFNIQMDMPHLSDTILLNNFLDTFNLTNKVTFSTHLSQHIIDLMLFETQSTIVNGIRQGHLFSDHHFIHADLCITTPKPNGKLISYRKLKNLCDTELAEDLRTMSLQGKTIEDLVTSYNSNLREILDKHAPLNNCRLCPCHSQPWFTDRIKDEIRVRQIKECKWKNNPTEYNLKAFYQQRRYVANIIKQAQRSFYIKKLLKNRTNFKDIFTITNKLLGRNDPLPLPPSDDPARLAQEFSNFFHDKIDNIKLQLKPTPDCPINNRYIEDRFLTQHCIHEFHEVREEEVPELLTKSPAKSCGLDLFPSKLLVRHHQEVVPILTQIVNASLTQGEFISELKNALLRPLLKKAGIDCIFKNYRPVSNLSFLSKLIERAVCNQITQHTESTGMLEKFQSAYRASHSTETALIKVKDDILRAVDNQRVNCLILVNLSATFDTISHPLLLNRLQHPFGIQGTVLKWFENYMLDHSQRVALDDSNNKAVISDCTILEQGVPQGSILGPILFTLYTSPLGDICREHDVF